MDQTERKSYPTASVAQKLNQQTKEESLAKKIRDKHLAFVSPSYDKEEILSIFTVAFVTPRLSEEVTPLTKAYFMFEQPEILEQIAFPAVHPQEHFARSIVYSMYLSENEDVKEIFLDTYKRYHKVEYNQLKRFSSVSNEELHALVDEDGMYDGFATCRKILMLKKLGCELPPYATFLLNDLAKNVREKETFPIIEPLPSTDKEDVPTLSFRKIEAYVGGRLCDYELFPYLSLRGLSRNTEFLRENYPGDTYSKRELRLHYAMLYYACQLSESLSLLRDIGEALPQTRVEDVEGANTEVLQVNTSEEKETSEVTFLKSQIKALKSEVRALKAENHDLREKVKENGSGDSVEDNTCDSAEDIPTDNALANTPEIPLDTMISELSEKNIIICGGYTTWVANLKKYFPNWSYTNTESFKFQSKSAYDHIFIMTSYVGHPLIYRAKSFASSQNIPIGYINSKEVGLVTREIYEQFFRDKMTH